MKFILSALKPTRKKLLVLGAAAVGVTAVRMYFGPKDDPAWSGNLGTTQESKLGTHTDKPPTSTSGSADKDTATKSTATKPAPDAKPGSTPNPQTTTTGDNKPSVQPGPVDALLGVGVGDRSSFPPHGSDQSTPSSNGTSLHTPSRPASVSSSTPVSGARLIDAAQSGPESKDGEPDATTSADKVSTGSRS